MSPLVEQQQFLTVLEDALRKRVCSVCVDRNLEGPCALEEQHECVLFDRLPKIARTLSYIRSNRMDDYITAIRWEVCSECPHQRLDGSCAQREEARCILDRYLPLIVDAVEETRAAFHQPAAC